MSARSKRALDRTLADHCSTTAGEVDPELLARIEDAMRRVPGRQREIFLAVRLDNLRYSQIAERTGLTVAQVERLFANALANFTRNLDQPHRHWWRRWLG